MNKVIIILMSLFLLGFQKISALDLLIDGDNEDLFNQTIVSSEAGKPLEYMCFNVLDGNLATVVALNISNRMNEETDYPFFRINFKKVYPFNKIVFYNGLQNSGTLYEKNSRAKEIEISLVDLEYEESKDGTYNKIILNKNGKEVKVNINETIKFTTNITLSDTTNGQMLAFPESSGNYWNVKVLSAYPGSKYEDICISEVEFWNKDEKYKVANLKQAKQEYIKLYIKKSLGWMSAGSLITTWNEDAYKKVIQAASWNYDKPDERSIVITFEKNGSLTADWFIKKKHVVNGRQLGRDYPLKTIGNWKFDEEGRLWIKVGKGEWKVSRSRTVPYSITKRYFVGTDLECDHLEWAGKQSK